MSVIVWNVIVPAGGGAGPPSLQLMEAGESTEQEAALLALGILLWRLFSLFWKV